MGDLSLPLKKPLETFCFMTCKHRFLGEVENAVEMAKQILVENLKMSNPFHASDLQYT
jgi:hypothetical protein